MKDIAVLLPVYKNDNPSFFEKSINSVLNQTYKDFIVFIGVDGPVYGELADKLKSYEFYESISVVYFEENRGLACVLNDLIRLAQQKEIPYYARMDADDICLPDRFQKQKDFLISHPEVDVVGGAIMEIDENDVSVGKTVHYPLSHEECRKFFRYRDCLAHPASFFRNSFFDKVIGYRPEYRKNQDTMLWFDGFINGCVFSNLNDVVLMFRISRTFYSRRNGIVRAKQMLKDRVMINRSMNFDFTATVFAYMMFLMTISPTFVKKLLYKLR